MESETQNKAVAKPLGRSITIGCILFIITLCIVLVAINHINYRRVLHLRYESFITDIIHYVDRHIDDDDLENCIATLERSEKFDELEKFMDGIKEDFSVHYLYIIVPFRKDGSGKIMSIISGENYYDRYVDTEGNLYLGWISDEEYDDETVETLLKIMQQREIVFHEEKTEWGLDYTGAFPLLDSQKKPYALLCVDVDITDIARQVRKHTIESLLIVIFLGFLFTFIFLYWIRCNVTNPIRLLEKCVVAFAERSHGQRNIDALQFEQPEIRTKNEVAYLASAVNQMTCDMRDYVEGIIEAELKAEAMRRQASQMSELANKDSLTGIRNKTAYDKEIKKMEYDMGIGSLNAFGIGMIDLNFLKKINDTYGHEQGNIAIKKLCYIVCTVFEHSPVFRIGGDEFVVILKGRDLENVDELIQTFHSRLSAIASDDNLEPWEKVSAAIGIAFYDSKIDANVLNVFKRADQNMYENKKEMKAVREE